MLVLLKLGAPMNRPPPESAGTSYFSRHVGKESRFVAIQNYRPMAQSGSARRCSSVVLSLKLTGLLPSPSLASLENVQKKRQIENAIQDAAT